MLRILFLTVALLAAHTLQAETAENAESPFVQALFTQLEALSLAPRLDEDGDIVFQKENRTYVLIFDPKDPGFMLLALPNIWSIDSEEERARVREAIASVNERAKLARLLERGDKIWVIAEAVYAEPGHAVPMLERLIGTVDNAVALFGMKMLSKEMD